MDVNGLTYTKMNEEIQWTPWTPCSKRLPEESGNYLVCDEYGHVFTHWFWTANDWGASNGQIIAWMPLPEPYKEEKESK